MLGIVDAWFEEREMAFEQSKYEFELEAVQYGMDPDEYADYLQNEEASRDYPADLYELPDEDCFATCVFTPGKIVVQRLPADQS